MLEAAFYPGSEYFEVKKCILEEWLYIVHEHCYINLLLQEYRAIHY
jgi:hypothetical protein